MSTFSTTYLPDQITVTPFSDGKDDVPAFYACGTKLLKHINNAEGFLHPEMMDLNFLSVRVHPSFPSGENRFHAVKVDGNALEKAQFSIGLAPQSFGDSRHVEFGDAKCHVCVKIVRGSVFVCSGCDSKQSYSADFKIQEGTQSLRIGVAVYYKNNANFAQFYFNDSQHRIPVTVTGLAKNMKLVVCSKTPGVNYSFYVKNIDMTEKDFEDSDDIIVFNKRAANRHKATDKDKKSKKSTKVVARKPKVEVYELPDTSSEDDNNSEDADYIEEDNITEDTAKRSFESNPRFAEDNNIECNVEEDDEVYVDDPKIVVSVIPRAKHYKKAEVTPYVNNRINLRGNSINNISLRGGNNNNFSLRNNINTSDITSSNTTESFAALFASSESSTAESQSGMIKEDVEENTIVVRETHSDPKPNTIVVREMRSDPKPKSKRVVRKAEAVAPPKPKKQTKKESSIEPDDEYVYVLVKKKKDGSS